MLKEKKELEDIVRLFNSGKIYLAYSRINDLLKNNSENLDVIYCHAQLSLKLNKIDISIKSYLKALSIRPNDVNLINRISSIYLSQNKLDKAAIYNDKSLLINKDNLKANIDKAYILYEKKEYNKSEEYINISIQKDPKNYFSQNLNGLIFIKKNKIRNAINCFEKAIKINPDYPDSYNNLGTCYYKLENLTKAFFYYKLSYKINDKDLKTISNIANTLSLIGKNKLAIKFYDKALNIDPNNNEILSNLALNYFRMRDLKNSKKYFEKFINLGIIDNDLSYAYSTLLLNANSFKDGWQYFEKRLLIKKNIKNLKNFIDYKNKTLNVSDLYPEENLLVLREQGIGEEILFSSIYSDLLKKFKNVKIETDKRLKTIFERSFKRKIFFEEGNIIKNKSEIKKFKNIVYSGSLAKFFRKKIDDFPSKPYIFANKTLVKQIDKRLGEKKEKLRIGISWKSKINIFGKLKSLDIKDFEILINSRHQIINLQYGDIDKELYYLKHLGKNIFVFDNIDLFNDIESCIAILSNMDYFVTVSNSTAHLAGALGVRTILIVPNQASSYYYWNLKDNNSIWYKSIKVISVNESVKKTMNKINKMII